MRKTDFPSKKSVPAVKSNGGLEASAPGELLTVVRVEGFRSLANVKVRVSEAVGDWSPRFLGAFLPHHPPQGRQPRQTPLLVLVIGHFSS